MAYYQGDYYQGDYYQGDPFLGVGALAGLAFKGIKKIFSRPKTSTALATIRSGSLSPGIRGAIGGIAGGLLPIPSFALDRRPGTVPSRGPIRTRIERILPGGRTGREAQACLAGYHFNKQVSTGRQTMGMEAGTFCVRNRRMNVANPRALRRSLRRVCGFGKLAARTRTSIGRAATAVGAGRGRGRSTGRSCGPRRKCA